MATEQKDLSNEIDLHNESQEKTVARAHDLVKTLLLLSGGALAVCASSFRQASTFTSYTKLLLRFKSPGSV